MNESSLKQKALLATLGVIAVYALAVVLWFTTFQTSWKKSERAYAKAKKDYLREEELIAAKSKWENAYVEAKSQMPEFDIGTATDTTWLQKMDEIAIRNHVSISQRKTAAETDNADNGEVKELMLEVPKWEGSFESLVGFLYELENSNEGMFDVPILSFKPSKGGFMIGSFSLSCAYMRKAVNE